MRCVGNRHTNTSKNITNKQQNISFTVILFVIVQMAVVNQVEQTENRRRQQNKILNVRCCDMYIQVGEYSETTAAQGL